MTNENFDLIEITYRDETPEYPDFEVFSRRTGVFTSLEKAEQAMSGQIAASPDTRRFAFRINRNVLDRCVFGKSKKRRAYLPDGSLWNETLASEIHDENGDLERFLGRTADKMRFNVGDLAEVWRCDRVSLELVYRLPPTPDKNPRDYKDDMYHTIDLFGEISRHDAVRLFPVRQKVNRELKKLLSDTYLKKVLKT